MSKNKGLSFRKKKKKKISASVVREVFSWIFSISISIILGVVLVFFFGMRVSMIGTSMEPTVYNTENVLVSKVRYLFSNPKRDDVVVFLPNGNEYSHYYVKRIVAIPGDTVQIIDGRLFVNGVLNSAYDKMEDPGIAEKMIELGDDEYFVLGDSRNSGEDSRSGNIGLISKQLIEGIVWFHLGSDEHTLGFVN